MPESPRWLIAHNHRSKAKLLIERACKKTSIITATTALSSGKRSESLKNSDDIIIPAPVADSVKKQLRKDIKGFYVLITNSELRNRLLITNFNWMVASLSYYALGKKLSSSSCKSAEYCETFVKQRRELFPELLFQL